MRYASASMLLLLLFSPSASGQDTTDISKQLNNPVASVTSIPFVFDTDFGPGNDVRTTLKAQPVIPFRLNQDFNVISRTIVPFDFQHGIFDGDVVGLGDTTQSFFITPARPGSVIWGIGPAFMLPTATDDRLGTGKFAIGATGLLLTEVGQLSIGVLATQLVSIAGDADRDDVNLTQLQPFANLSVGDGQTLSANLEASYNWTDEQWTVPLNLGYSKVFQVNGRTMKFQAGVRRYLVTPDGGPEWGLRTGVTFVLP